MIASVLEPRRDGKSSFRTLKTYLVDKLRVDESPETEDHLTDGGNLLAFNASGVVSETNALDMDTIVQEFESVLAQKPHIEEPIYHFMISWHESDLPDNKLMLEVAREAINRLGFSDHQYLSAIHRDTDNPHVHVAVNRIHPDSYYVHSPWNDYAKLGQLMTEVEMKHQFFATPQGGVKDRASTPAADTADAHGDVSFTQWCRSHIPELIESAASWDQVHKRLNSVDVQMVPYGQGMVFQSISSPEFRVKASAVSRAFAASKIIEKLGQYVPSSQLQSADIAVSNKTGEASNDPAQMATLATDDKEASDYLQETRSKLQKSLTRWHGRERSSWESLHRLMERQGYRLTQYGQGLSIINDAGQRVAASKVDRRLSLIALERRLGEFEPSVGNGSNNGYSGARLQAPRNTADKTSGNVSKNKYSGEGQQQPGKNLWLLYQSYREQMPSQYQMRRSLGAEIRRIRREAREERNKVYESVSSPALRAAYLQDIQWQTIRRIQGERLRQQAIYEAECEANPPLGWRDWLIVQARNGDDEALRSVVANNLSAHKQRSGINAVTAVETQNQIEAVRRVLTYQSRVRRTGIIDYLDEHNNLLMSQYKNHYQIHASRNENIASAMRMAVDTYGPQLRLTGDDYFKRQAIRELAKIEKQDRRRISLTDEGLQRELELERQQLASKTQNRMK